MSKPAAAYTLTAQAEDLFPKAYGTVLRHVLAVLGGRLSPTETEAFSREVGRRIAAGYTVSGTLAERAERALSVLNGPGRVAELTVRNGRHEIQGYGCPFAETLLAALLGTPVRESCTRGVPLRCHFTVQQREAIAPAGGNQA